MLAKKDGAQNGVGQGGVEPWAEKGFMCWQGGGGHADGPSAEKGEDSGRKVHR